MKLAASHAIISGKKVLNCWPQNAKNKKKKNNNENGSYNAPTYTPTLPTYDFTTTRPITFSFDVDENYNVNNHRDDDAFTSNLIRPAIGLGGTPGP